MTTKTDTRQGECGCGKVKVTCTGDPVRVSICHCHACQRRSGSPFAQQARWASEMVKVEGVTRSYTRGSDDGGTVTSQFCPTCGSTVCYVLEIMPGFTAVPVGAFADSTFPAPILSIYEARKHRWVTVPDEIEHVD